MFNVNIKELQLQMTQVCSDTGELGGIFISQITTLQREIESLSLGVHAEYELLYEMEEWMTSTEVTEWVAGLEQFKILWQDYEAALERFHTKASDMVGGEFIDFVNLFSGTLELTTEMLLTV